MPSLFNSCIKTKPPPTDLCLPLLHTTSIIKLRGRAFTSSMALLMARKNSAEAINSCRIWKCQPTCLLRERSMLGSVKCSSPTLTTGRPCELSSSPQRRPLLTITTLVLDCKASFRLFKASVFVEYCSPKGSMVVATKALRDRRWHLGIARPGLSPMRGEPVVARSARFGWGCKGKYMLHLQSSSKPTVECYKNYLLHLPLSATHANRKVKINLPMASLGPRAQNHREGCWRCLSTTLSLKRQRVKVNDLSVIW